MCIKKTKEKRQVRVEITFSHGGSYTNAPPKVIIEILPNQEFQTGLCTDILWEGDTIIKEFDWVAGFTRTYEYFYQ